MRGGGEDDERVFYAAETDPGTGAPSQFTYMRDMRERYKEDIMARFAPRRHQRPRQQSFPMSGGPTSGPSDYDYSHY